MESGPAGGGLPQHLQIAQPPLLIQDLVHGAAQPPDRLAMATLPGEGPGHGQAETGPEGPPPGTAPLTMGLAGCTSISAS